MAWVRCCGGSINKIFTILFTKSGYNATLSNSIITCETPSPLNYGAAFYPYNVPQTICTFNCNKQFKFDGTLSEEAIGNTITQYISLQVYCNNVLIGETGQSTASGDKNVHLTVPAGNIDVKINNWRNLGSGNALCRFSAY